MPRLRTRTPDLTMIDAAAMLYADRGATNTSLQNVADAVGVSKSAVLHHFGSKAGLELRVWQAVRELIATSITPLRGTQSGPTRDALAVEALLDCALEHPGLVAYGLARAEDMHLRSTVLRAFDDVPDPEDHDRLVRVSAALAAVGVLAGIARREGRIDAWRPLILSTCATTLSGAPDPAIASPRRTP